MDAVVLVTFAGVAPVENEDAAIMLQAMAGHDPKDSTSVNAPVPDYRRALTADIRGLKVGIPKEYVIDGINGTNTE